MACEWQPLVPPATPSFPCAVQLLHSNSCSHGAKLERQGRHGRTYPGGACAWTCRGPHGTGARLNPDPRKKSALSGEMLVLGCADLSAGSSTDAPQKRGATRNPVRFSTSSPCGVRDPVGPTRVTIRAAPGPRLGAATVQPKPEGAAMI